MHQLKWSLLNKITQYIQQVLLASYNFQIWLENENWNIHKYLYKTVNIANAAGHFSPVFMMQRGTRSTFAENTWKKYSWEDISRPRWYIFCEMVLTVKDRNHKLSIFLIQISYHSAVSLYLVEFFFFFFFCFFCLFVLGLLFLCWCSPKCFVSAKPLLLYISHRYFIPNSDIPIEHLNPSSAVSICKFNQKT